MKKATIILLSVLLIAGLFVSCKPEPEVPAELTFTEILAMADGGFPTSESNAWKRDSNTICYLGEYLDTNCLLFFEGGEQKYAINVDSHQATYQNGNYVYEETSTFMSSTSTTTFVFTISEGKLVKISFASTGFTANGDYTAPIPE